jgi:hypothetical protein
MMLGRVDAETLEFEECTTLLQAMRSVHARMLKDLLLELSSDRVRDEVQAMQSAMSGGILNFGAKKSFVALCERLRGLLATAERRSVEIREMLQASFGRLNAEFGFSLSLGKSLSLDRFGDELQLIESNYVQYLGLTLALRLAQPKFMEQFRRMLVSKLRVVFENASSDVELWNKAVSAQVDSQLRERRKAFKRRRETMERVQQAAGELESRIAELEQQDVRMQGWIARTQELAEALREHALAAPLATDVASEEALDLPLFGDEGQGDADAPPRKQALTA